jgi:uncharacterized membrane protein
MARASPSRATSARRAATDPPTDLAPRPPERAQRRAPVGLHPERLNFLTDGVYAIALTLLVLELKVPEHLRPEQVLPALLENWPKFFAYLIGFSAAAIGWTFNFLVHPLVRRSGPTHLACTLVSLMAASLIPFSASVMGSYPNSPWGIVVYAIDVGLLAGVFAIDLVHAERTVIPPSIDRRPIRLLWMTAVGVSLCAVVCGGLLSFVSPHLTLAIIGVVTVGIWAEYFVLVGWIGRVLNESALED